MIDECDGDDGGEGEDSKSVVSVSQADSAREEEEGSTAVVEENVSKAPN